MTRTIPLSCLLSGALLAACSTTGPSPTWHEPDWAVEDTGPDLPPPVLDIPEPDTGPEQAWDTSDAGPLTGYFAVQAIIQAKVAIVSFEVPQILLLRVLQHGEILRQQVTFCEIRIPSVEGVAELIIPPAAQALLRQKSETAEGPYLDGTQFKPERQVALLGVEFGALDPFSEPLPDKESPECPADGEPTTVPCSADEDQDGNPGVTMEADVVVCEQIEQLYITLRAILDLEGTVSDDHHTISGTVDPQLDWRVVGWSNDCLEIAAEIEAEIAEGNTFKAVRVDGARGWPVDIDDDGDGRIDCGEVVQALDGPLAEHFSSDR